MDQASTESGRQQLMGEQRVDWVCPSCKTPFKLPASSVEGYDCQFCRAAKIKADEEAKLEVANVAQDPAKLPADQTAAAALATRQTATTNINPSAQTAAGTTAGAGTINGAAQGANEG